MKINYINILLKKFPNIASGRKNFKDFDRRIKKNLALTIQYNKNNKNKSRK